MPSFELKAFLDTIVEHPTVVLPHLQSFAASNIGGNEARELLALLDRGAFPDLTTLSQPSISYPPDTVSIKPKTTEDFTQLCAVLARLPGGSTLNVCELIYDNGLSWDPFTALLVGGRLSNLKCVRETNR